MYNWCTMYVVYNLCYCSAKPPSRIAATCSLWMQGIKSDWWKKIFLFDGRAASIFMCVNFQGIVKNEDLFVLQNNLNLHLIGTERISSFCPFESFKCFFPESWIAAIMSENFYSFIAIFLWQVSFLSWIYAAWFSILGAFLNSSNCRPLNFL